VNVGSVFSGDGLLDFGLTLAGWEHAFLCESEPERRAILSLRWPGVPIYRDVRDVDGGAPRVDLLVGGFPCRGASTAGLRAGLDHPETALWREMARAIGALRPRFVLVENVANLLSVRSGAAWGTVLGDLAALGYVRAWDCLPAAAFGAPHLRDRVFCVAADADQGVGWDELVSMADGVSHGADPAGSGRDAPNPDEAGRPAGWRGIGERGGLDGSRRGDERAAGDNGTPADSKSANGQGTRPGRSALGRTEPNDSVDWGKYEPAIRRWEAIQGPAPEPLLRGVDARGARKVVRSRLSALGDGVQVQAGHFLGAKLMTLALHLKTVQKEAA
jgi:site-specific DNA-cytosine methylase